MDDPVEIARLLGVRYDGVQEGLSVIPDKFQFTDIDYTLTTFYGTNLGEAFDRLAQVRRAYNQAGRDFPIPSFRDLFEEKG